MNRPQRKTIRYQKWHYDSQGYYFITICTYKREHVFADLNNKQIAEMMWQKIPSFKSETTVRLDEWVVMPNHIHGILVITFGDLVHDARPKTPLSGSIGALVGAYKASVSKRINHLHQSKGMKIWQRGYYDRVIRDEAELQNVRQYIRNNPVRWDEDRDNLDELIGKMSFNQ